MRKYVQSYLFILLALTLGITTGVTGQTMLIAAANTIASLFMNFLSMLAAPVVFLAIFSTLLSIEGLHQIKRLGRKVLTYTLLTTTLASLAALCFFLLLDPVSGVLGSSEVLEVNKERHYLQFLVDIVPSNIAKAFVESKVISLVFLGFLLGIGGHFLPSEERDTLKKGFSALFHLFLKVTEFSRYLMPFAIWAFTTLLVQEFVESEDAGGGLWKYLSVVLLANFFQGLVIIPLLLKTKGISPLQLAKGGHKALLVAFFTKSSNTALPVALKAAKDDLGIEPKIVHFSLPLCTVVNMNGCAAFILTTVLFVAGVHGHTFTPFDFFFWMIMSIFAAIGNAGVPMGCFFLSSAFLMSMGIPLSTMGKILPFYALIDMVETALNVWSDLSVTSLVNKECKEEALQMA